MGNSGLATETNTTTNSETSAITTTAADQSGRLTKLSGIDGTPASTFSVNQTSTNGTTTAQASAVDASGNIYVIGNATGDFKNQLNQATQDSYLTKYDSAGHVVWQKLLGSAGSANGYGLALDPSGGVVVTGSSTAQLMTTSISNGNNDSFVARYSANGDQTWIKQIQTLATNQSNSVSVDASGNITIGGSVSGGVIGAGMTTSGKADAFLPKFDSKGKLLSESQFGTSGNDSVAATATGSDGSLYVASVQNGRAVISKYAGGDITVAPTWSQDLGDLAAGRRHRRAHGCQWQGLCLRHHQQRQSHGGRCGQHRGYRQRRARRVCLQSHRQWRQRQRRPGQLYRYFGHRHGGGGHGGRRRHGLCRRLHHRHLRGRATQRSERHQRFRHRAQQPTARVKWTRQFGGSGGVSSGAGIAIDTQGSSVLDALGSPRGAISLNQSVELAAQTTLRPGDNFKIRIEGIGARTTTITIDKGETFDPLATKINAQLGGIGKAKTNYTGGGSNLKLTVNPGHTITLLAGPKDFDGLARLGIEAGVLTAPAKDGKTAMTDPDITPTFGLGFSGTLDISTRTGANMARTQLLAVLSSIQSTYQTTNAAPASNTAIGNIIRQGVGISDGAVG